MTERRSQFSNILVRLIPPCSSRSAPAASVVGTLAEIDWRSRLEIRRFGWYLQH